MVSESVEIPKGYLMDAKGHLVPKKMVKEIDIKRTKAVEGIIKKAQELQILLSAFKGQTLVDVQAFIDMSGEQYDAKRGGKKGNVSLVTFDGKYKVTRAIQEHVVFDERLQIAQQLINECISKWSKGTRSEIRALVNDAFNADKDGQVNNTRIQGLKRIDIKDETWLRAMQAINDSQSISGSKTYLRFYERMEDGSYKPIPLDIAAS